MDRENVRSLLLQLRDTICEEREHAKALNLELMIAAVRRKETLLHILSTVKELHPEELHYAREVQRENRRNAFLFRETLNWIQDTMVFFGKNSVPATYSQEGISQNTGINGRLLSGKI